MLMAFGIGAIFVTNSRINCRCDGEIVAGGRSMLRYCDSIRQCNSITTHINAMIIDAPMTIIVNASIRLVMSKVGKLLILFDTVTKIAASDGRIYVLSS